MKNSEKIENPFRPILTLGTRHLKSNSRSARCAPDKNLRQFLVVTGDDRNTVKFSPVAEGVVDSDAKISLLPNISQVKIVAFSQFSTSKNIQLQRVLVHFMVHFIMKNITPPSSKLSSALSKLVATQQIAGAAPFPQTLTESSPKNVIPQSEQPAVKTRISRIVLELAKVAKNRTKNSDL